MGYNFCHWDIAKTQEELRQEEEYEEEQCKKEKHEEVIKDRMHQYQENPNMQITGEDAELVLDCDHCGPWFTEYVREDCDDCVQGWVREDYRLCIIEPRECNNWQDSKRGGCWIYNDCGGLQCETRA